MTPAARGPVADEALVRPDWTTGRPRDHDRLWLDRNENADPELASVAKKVLDEIDPRALWSYPENAPLYRKLAGQLDVDPRNLVLTAGSDGAIRSVFEAFINPGDAVVHTLPTFAMYPVYCQMYGAGPLAVRYQRAAGGPRLEADTVIAAIADAEPTLVCLPNPDSPTGTVFPPEQLRRIIEAAGDAGAVMLVDEAYHPFYEPTVLPWIKDYAHLVVARTFAKAWGLAGLRIGYAASCPDLTLLLHKVRPMYEVNTLAVAVMYRMLDFADAMRASVRRLNEGRDAFLAAMESLGFQTFHAKGNFLHVAFGDAAPQIHAVLEGVVLYRRDFTEPCLRGFSRFSATTAEGFAPVIARIRDVVQGTYPEGE